MSTVSSQCASSSVDSASSSRKKSVSFETWGCQMNVADSESMFSLLSGEYRLEEDVEKSDLVILNTCHIREKAYHKVVSRLGHLRRLQEKTQSSKSSKSSKLKVVVAGCVAQAEGKMLASLPGVDVVVGPGRIPELKELLARSEKSGKTEIALGFPDQKPKEKLLRDHRVSAQVHPGKNPVSRYLTIQKGCDNFCTFCVVPHTRGGEVSLMPEEVLDGVHRLLDLGAQEICLLGQKCEFLWFRSFENGEN